MSGTLATLPDFYGYEANRRGRVLEWPDGTPIPWMTFPAIAYLQQLDFSEKDVFEYGAGSSTEFWSARARRVVSVESNAEWYERVQSRNLPNAEIALSRQGDEYAARVAHRSPHDVIVVDGRWRYDSAVACLAHLREGGMIVLDNSERYPVVTEHFRSHGLIQVDFIGHGPINRYVWSTSIFLSRGFAFRPAKAIQPHAGPGMSDSIEHKPEYAELGNQPGSRL